MIHVNFPWFGGRRLLAALGLIALLASHAPNSDAAAPRVLAVGQRPQDSRLQPLKDLDGYFPFQPYTDRAAWERRAEAVRRQMRVALGVWPMPSSTELNPVVHGRIEREDYTVEKVYFESLPGFFVTGTLYRPKKAGKHPGVLSPHGHWENGRFFDSGADRVRQEIALGAERFENGGRSPLQARCVQLARMGCVVFHYDMIGYADSAQISFEIAHRFSKQRPDMNTPEKWGLYSPQAEAHFQSVMGLQTINSFRALDFLSSLPDVDPQRIGVTGASGGGTQTFILSALDPRVTAAFPAVMVSTAMQGGCTCENASLLRVDTGNIEFAALFAPRPLGLTAADDWTKEVQTKGFPELRQHYQMHGAADRVMLKALVHFGHNYNYPSRSAMYSWFNKHLGLGQKEPIVEEDYPRLNAQEMSVWDSEHPKPPGGPEFERGLLRWLAEDAAKQLKTAESSTEQYRQLVGGALDAMIRRTVATAGKVEFELDQKTAQGAGLQMTGILRNLTYGEELPAIFLYPKSWNGQTVLWFSGKGKSSLYAPDGGLVGDVRTLLEKGFTVAGVDLLYQGEFVNGGLLARTAPVKNPREFAGYTFGYNDSVFAQRVHDILTVLAFVKNHERQSKHVAVVGLDTAGPLVALACAQAGSGVDAIALETGGFRFGKLLDYLHPDFLPGGAKYGDLPGFLALCAPAKLFLAGEAHPDLVKAGYDRAGAPSNLRIFEGAPGEFRGRATAWLEGEAGVAP